MVTLVVKFPREGYKIRQIVGQISSHSKKIVVHTYIFCEETYMSYQETFESDKKLFSFESINIVGNILFWY